MAKITAIQEQLPLLEALAFSIREHEGQYRADGKTPYSSHPARVCLIVRQLFGVSDPATLTVALLHDTFEDTTIDFDDIEEKFGKTVARDVAALSKDSRLPEDERETAYCQALSAASPAAKLVKMGDIIDNLLDSAGLSDRKRRKTINKVQRYLTAMVKSFQKTDPSSLPAAAKLAQDLIDETLAKVDGA